jgi:DNA-binding NarL/FixJ family response regulator
MHSHSPATPLKIFLVEDSILVRRRLATLMGLIDGVEIVGEAEDSSRALSGIVASQAHVAVLDLHLAGSSGMDVLTALARSGRPVIPIVLTNHCTAPVRQACLSAGAKYFFDKTSEFKLALDTIEKIARDRSAGTTQ